MVTRFVFYVKHARALFILNAMAGFVYLVEIYDVEKKQTVFKIGRSKKSKRPMEDYPGSICHLILRFSDHRKAENELIEIFGKKFMLFKPREWFVGDLRVMKNTIYDYEKGAPINTETAVIQMIEQKSLHPKPSKYQYLLLETIKDQLEHILTQPNSKNAPDSFEDYDGILRIYTCDDYLKYCEIKQIVFIDGADHIGYIRIPRKFHEILDKESSLCDVISLRLPDYIYVQLETGIAFHQWDGCAKAFGDEFLQPYPEREWSKFGKYLKFKLCCSINDMFSEIEDLDIDLPVLSAQEICVQFRKKYSVARPLYYDFDYSVYQIGVCTKKNNVIATCLIDLKTLNITPIDELKDINRKILLFGYRKPSVPSEEKMEKLFSCITTCIEQITDIDIIQQVMEHYVKEKRNVYFMRKICHRIFVEEQKDTMVFEDIDYPYNPLFCDFVESLCFEFHVDSVRTSFYEDTDIAEFKQNIKNARVVIITPKYGLDFKKAVDACRKAKVPNIIVKYVDKDKTLYNNELDVDQFISDTKEKWLKYTFHDGNNISIRKFFIDDVPLLFLHWISTFKIDDAYECLYEKDRFNNLEAYSRSMKK